MTTTTEEVNDFSAINPIDVYRYLQEHGWEEEQKIGSRASILSINKRERKFSVLLPLLTEIPDYFSRMYDLFRTLEVVERRPKSEIIKTLTGVNSVAIERNREILSLRFKFIYDYEQEHLSAKNVGMVLASLQDFCDAVGQVEAGKIVERGRIQKEITDRTELSIFETFKGSFGVRLAFAPNAAQLNFLENPLAERVSSKFLELIRLSSNTDKEELKQALLKIKRRAASRYRKFLMSLIDSQSNLDIGWGSMNPEGGGYASLSFENTINTVEFINKMEEEDPEEYTIIGELVVANKNRNTLELEDIQERKKYFGEVSDSVLNQGVKWTIGYLYSATFQEVTSINPATGEEKIERTIIHLSRISDSE